MIDGTRQPTYAADEALSNEALTSYEFSPSLRGTTAGSFK